MTADAGQCEYAVSRCAVPGTIAGPGACTLFRRFRAWCSAIGGADRSRGSAVLPFLDMWDCDNGSNQNWDFVDGTLGAIEPKSGVVVR